MFLIIGSLFLKESIRKAGKVVIPVRSRKSGYKSYKLISLETSAMSIIGSFMDFSPKRASTTSCGALR